MSNHKEIFSRIYANDEWGGSGGGSLPEVTIPYRELIENFLRDNDIKSVIDFGCGDWMFSHLINWDGVTYTGIDCVQSVVNANIKKYATDSIHFYCSDKLEGSADLLILKDVLQHWTNKQVTDFLDKADFKYILITNNSDQTKDWEDNEAPLTRALSAAYFPLRAYSPTILLQTHINEPKETCLITK